MKTPVKGTPEKQNVIGSSPILKSPIKQEFSKPEDRSHKTEGHAVAHKTKPEVREKKSHRGKHEEKEKVAAKPRAEEETAAVPPVNVEDNKDNNYTDDFEEDISQEVRVKEIAHAHGKLVNGGSGT